MLWCFQSLVLSIIAHDVLLFGPLHSSEFYYWKKYNVFLFQAVFYADPFSLSWFLCLVQVSGNRCLATGFIPAILDCRYQPEMCADRGQIRRRIQICKNFMNPRTFADPKFQNDGGLYSDYPWMIKLYSDYPWMIKIWQDSVNYEIFRLRSVARRWKVRRL